MAVTVGITGSNQTVASSEEQFFSVPSGVLAPSTIMVRNRAGSTSEVVVRIPELHGSTGGVPIPAGEKEYFRLKDGKFTVGYISGTGGSVDWGPVASTQFS